MGDAQQAIRFFAWKVMGDVDLRCRVGAVALDEVMREYVQAVDEYVPGLLGEREFDRFRRPTPKEVRDGEG